MSSFHYLTKSRFLAGLQCHKMLWLSINEPDLAGETDEATQHLFDVGHKVGENARLRFLGGMLVTEDHMHMSQAIKSTEAFVKNGAPAIFEATVRNDKLQCRADVLKRVGKNKNEWDIYEVKMSTKLKDEHLDDVAIQRYCFEKAGYKIRKTFLVHINTEYIRHGDIDVQELFLEEDITRQVLEIMPDVPQKVKELVAVLASTKCPKAEPGDQCYSPYECAFIDNCIDPPPEYSIYELSRGKKIWPKLEEMGIELLKDLPGDFPLSVRQSQHVLSVKTKKAVVDKKSLSEYLDQLEYPLYHFDFETINPAIPLFENSRPYQTTPFQFSLHVQKKKNGECEHYEFLLKEAADPREQLIKEMLRLLGKKGTIVAYNMSFETGVIKDLARTFPKYADQLNDLIPRFWDLIVPFRNGDYAHYDFHGSASIKDVLPVLVPSLSYKKLDIQEGGTASLKYELWATGEMKRAEWEKIYKDLLKYCGLDTLAMVEILRVLYKEVKEK